MSYKTYQEAKIAMPLACIIHDTDNNRFFGMPSREGTVLTNDGCKFAEAKDHCMSMLTFSELGHKLVDDDLYQNEDGRVFTVGRLGYEAKYCNLLSSYCFPSKIYILRAATLENQMNIDKVETQTEHQEEMSAVGGEVEWNDKDEVPPVGWRGLSAYTEEGCDNWCDFHDGVVMGVNGDYVWMAHHGKFQRVHHIGSIEFKAIETPQQREDRERLEAAYDLCITAYPEECTFNEFQAGDIDSINKWLAIVDKTNYRNGVK